MRRLPVALLLTAALALPAQAQMSALGGGNKGGSSGGGVYSGPGDALSGASYAVYFGTIPVSAAYATANGASFDWSCTGGFTGTVHFVSGGAFNSGDTSTMTTNCAANPIIATKIYDEIGTNHCTASGSTAPTFVLSGPNGKPAFHFDAAASQTCALTTGLAVAQGFTDVFAVEWTGNFSANNVLLGSTAGSTDSEYFQGAAGLLIGFFAGGSGPQAAFAHNTFSATQVVFNGASSVFNIDGTETPANDTGGNNRTGPTLLGSGAGGSYTTGYMAIAGEINAALSSGNRTATCHNLFTNLGTAVSC